MCSEHARADIDSNLFRRSAKITKYIFVLLFSVSTGIRADMDTCTYNTDILSITSLIIWVGAFDFPYDDKKTSAGLLTAS